LPTQGLNKAEGQVRVPLPTLVTPQPTEIDHIPLPCALERTAHVSPGRSEVELGAEGIRPSSETSVSHPSFFPMKPEEGETHSTSSLSTRNEASLFVIAIDQVLR
jgi:hypothetical protein